MNELSFSFTPGLFEEALPKEIQFYHLGFVQKTHEVSTSSELSTSLGIRIYGDLSALFIFRFPNSEDASIYSELSNVVASQLTQELNKKQGLILMISPPMELSPDRVSQILENCQQSGLLLSRQPFLHSHGQSSVPLETWLVPMPLERGGNA